LRNDVGRSMADRSHCLQNLMGAVKGMCGRCMPTARKKGFEELARDSMMEMAREASL
jgi:hypothetical protein